MVPLAAPSEEREQPLVLVARTARLGEEVSSAQHRKLVKLTRKRAAGQSGGQMKGHTLAARGGKGHLQKAGLTGEPVQPRKPSSSETAGPMSSSVLLQERGRRQPAWPVLEENIVRKKVFLPMVSRRVITSNPVLLPVPDGVTDPNSVRRTPVLLTNFSGSQKGSAERNVPVILTSKEFDDYSGSNEPVNLSMKPTQQAETRDHTGSQSFQRHSVTSGPPRTRLHGETAGSHLSREVAEEQPKNLTKQSRSERTSCPPPSKSRLSFSSQICLESVLTPSECLLSHSVSITPIRKARKTIKEPREDKYLGPQRPVKEETVLEPPPDLTVVLVDVKQEPEDVDPLEQKPEMDIDDDEETYLQRMDRDMASMVQVKLEYGTDDMEEADVSGFACSRCPRTYARKQMCDLHMRRAHNMAKCKERCDICGVRFINVRAHKEKYHFFVDVDKCSLCGKVVKYLASHHCPLQAGGPDKESKMDCPSCGNLVKQKYLKIHQKNHCVGIRTSTFANFRTVSQTAPERIPLQLTPRPESGGGEERLLPASRGREGSLREVHLAYR